MTGVERTRVDASGRGALCIAAWQCEPRPLDVGGNLRRLEDACRRAADAGADVLVTPEMFLSGYAIDPAELRQLAEAPDGPAAAAVAGISARTGVAVVYGFPERGADGAVFNAANAVDDGRVIGHHRKAHLFGALDRERYTPAAELSPVFELRGCTAALLICYDVEFPEAVRAVALAGAEVVLVPTANPAGYEVVARVLVPARAYENRCVVAYANYCGSDAALDYGGRSTICASDGTAAALAGTVEELLVASVAFGGPRDPDYLADRRPELYREGGAALSTRPRSRPR